jgi:hypothetical protein
MSAVAALLLLGLALMRGYDELSYRLPASKRYRRDGSMPSRRYRYVTVVDNRPFGYQIETWHTTKLGARLAAAVSNTTKAERRDVVLAENERARDPEYVARVAKAVTDLDKHGVGSWWRRRSQSL